MRDSARRNEGGCRANRAMRRGIFVAGAQFNLQRPCGLALAAKASVSSAILVGQSSSFRPARRHDPLKQLKFAIAATTDVALDKEMQ